MIPFSVVVAVTMRLLLTFGSHDDIKEMSRSSSTYEDMSSQVEVPYLRCRSQSQVMPLAKHEVRKRWRAHTYRKGAVDFEHLGFTCWGLDEDSIYNLCTSNPEYMF